MLTCYPIEAANENWLHDSIVEIINVVHIKLDAHQALPNCQAEWEALVPNTLSAENRDNLIKARGVRDRRAMLKAQRLRDRRVLERQWAAAAHWV